MKIEQAKNIKPILVTGIHRSGTTWIGKMLSTSPDVVYIHEPSNPCISKMFPGICSAKFSYWYEYITNDNELNYRRSIHNTLNFNYDLNQQILNNTCFRDLKRTFQEYWHFHQSKSKKLTPLIKDPFTLFSAEWLAKEFDMNVLVSVRHPAAFISSIKRLDWNYDFSHFLQQPLLMKDHLYPFEEEMIEYSRKPTTLIEQGCLIWKIIYTTVNQYIKKHPDWIYIRYEDIAREPIPNFANIFSQLKLNFSESVKNTVKEYCQAEKSAKKLSGEYYLAKFDSKSNTANWKNKLTPSEIKQIRNNVESVSSSFYSDSDW